MKRYLKDSLITLTALFLAFGLSLLFQYIFNVKQHITTVFVFAVFLVSLFAEGSPYFSSALSRTERVAEHLVNVGKSVM